MAPSFIYNVEWKAFRFVGTMHRYTLYNIHTTISKHIQRKNFGTFINKLLRHHATLRLQNNSDIKVNIKQKVLVKVKRKIKVNNNNGSVALL